MALEGSKNPFYSPGDDDDFGFGSSKPSYGAKKDPFLDDVEDRPLSRYELLQQQKQASMARQLQSTERAMASIYDSEQTGIATAEELVKQGEQLDNTEKNLDKINADMKTSQRHLNSIKSVFGSFKNWWQGKDKPANQSTTEPQEKEPTKLQRQLENSSKSGTHPAYRIRSGDVQGFYEEDNDLDNQFLASGRSADGMDGPKSGYDRRGPSYAQKQEPMKKTGFKEYDEQFEKNVGAMSEGMTKLKSLALGLGDEIERQNDQLDRIEAKTDKGDIQIRDKNRQMKHILGK